MCGFQAPGNGFFPDKCEGKQTKEHGSIVSISVLEGNPTFKYIETKINEYFGVGGDALQGRCSLLSFKRDLLI
jgi:hypothetical protein